MMWQVVSDRLDLVNGGEWMIKSSASVKILLLFVSAGWLIFHVYFYMDEWVQVCSEKNKKKNFSLKLINILLHV